MIAQATDNQPLMIESAIVNQSEQEVLILPGGAGRPLDYVPPLVDQGIQLVLIPDSYTVSIVGELTDQQVEGCWRFGTASGDPVERTVLATSFPVTLEAKTRYAVRYEVYQDGSAGVCFPDGRYRADVAMDFREPNGTAVFTKHLKYTLQISKDGHTEFSLQV